MYTRKELEHAQMIIKVIAKRHNDSESHVRAAILDAMNVSRTTPNPAIQAKWATFSYAGAEPTAEEFILWISSLVHS